MNIVINKYAPNGLVADSFRAFLTEGATYTEIEEYPILHPEMISKDIPKRIMPFAEAINYRGYLSDTFICTFSPDETFERIRKNPQKYLEFFSGTAGIIGFDFSIHTDMPKIKQKSQINDNLSLTYFYGNNGIRIIPNIRCGTNDLLPEFFKTIPKNNIVAIGTHGFIKTISEKCEWYCFIEQIIKELHPSTIIVYGPLNSKLFDDLRNTVNFVFYEPSITKQYKEVFTNVNKGTK